MALASDIDLADAVARYRAGATFRELGAHFGVHEKVLRDRMRAIPGFRARARGSRVALDPADVAPLWADGWTIAAIQEHFGVSQTAVQTALDTLGAERMTAAPGRGRSLTAVEQAELAELWDKVPRTHKGGPVTTTTAFHDLFEHADKLAREGVADAELGRAVGQATRMTRWRRVMNRPRLTHRARSTRYQPIRPVSLVAHIQWSARCNRCGSEDTHQWADDEQARRALRIFEQTHDCQDDREEARHLRGPSEGHPG